MKKSLILFLCLIAVLSFTSCSSEGSGGETSGGKGFLCPYEAYNLEKGDLEISGALYDNPPKAIEIKPFLLLAFTREGIPLEMEKITLEKGEACTINIDETVLISKSSTGQQTGYMNDEIEILFDPPKKEGLMFTIHNKGGYKIVNEHVGYKEPKVREESFDSEIIYSIAKIGVEGIPYEPYLVIFLGEKGAPGNSGELLCEITGVRR